MAFEMFVLHFQSEVVMTIIEIISYSILSIVLIATIYVNERDIRGK
tara:strand:+ start:309 stop:446 length:138 start_codon:yes stop_codon:yes gene_type:complete